MLAATARLGGLLPLEPPTQARWAPAGAWRLPVGDGYTLASERTTGHGLFYVLRGVEWDGARASHQGADLAEGASGATVRAAAGGLVVRVGDRGAFGGYGTHVVVAHRLADEVVAYSVYAHLLRGSPRVREGQSVLAGQPLGRVGATGRATTPHLHFEVRITETPDERWEHARVEDPLAFVSERLPAHRADSTATMAFLEWGECAGLVSPAMREDDALTREVWWRMLAAASQGPTLDPALPPRALRDSLIAWAILPEEDGDHGPGGALSWEVLARDLARVRSLGVRTGHSPLAREAHRDELATVYGSSFPSAHADALADRDGRPAVLDAVMLLADVGGTAGDPDEAAVRSVRSSRSAGHGKTKHVRSKRSRHPSADVHASPSGTTAAKKPSGKKTKSTRKRSGPGATKDAGHSSPR